MSSKDPTGIGHDGSMSSYVHWRTCNDGRMSPNVRRRTCNDERMSPNVR